MKTHILFAENLQNQSKMTFSVKPITEEWHLTCNNFKGTYAECVAEGEKRRKEAISFFAMRNRLIVEPHYPNAAYGSSEDY